MLFHSNFLALVIVVVGGDGPFLRHLITLFNLITLLRAHVDIILQNHHDLQCNASYTDSNNDSPQFISVSTTTDAITSFKTPSPVAAYLPSPVAASLPSLAPLTDLSPFVILSTTSFSRPCRFTK